jgi:PiT family inorganic phosphate transporter
MMLILAVTVLLALTFILTNGLHDASSVVATFIACGAATPLQAILLAAVFGLAGALFSGNAVGNTIASIGDLPVDEKLLPVILAALMGAVVWNLFTWHFGLPSSSTHALVGGIIGAVWISYGSRHVLWGWQEIMGAQPHLAGVLKVIVSLLFSPLFGFIIGYVLQKVTMFLLRNAKFTVNRRLQQAQWLMAALLAFSHGANDTQKTVGLVAVVLVGAQLLPSLDPPLWIRLSAGLLMFTGTMFGGWAIMKTVGSGIYSIRPLHSLNSQISAGSSVALATLLGAPVSTTHVVVGSIVGVGTAEEYRMVNWKISQEILMAWFITIPAAAMTAAIMYLSFSIFGIGGG